MKSMERYGFIVLLAPRGQYVTVILSWADDRIMTAFLSGSLFNTDPATPALTSEYSKFAV
jgi:hypothetical protein